MLLPVADGLRHAHDKNIVHRDIKPDNIFLATDALGRIQPKLLDFGIAKVGQNAVDAKLTQVGTVLGSPEYMSPEQAIGADDVDERTDVWSLCVVLYEMMTGTVPFRRANYNALMQAIIHDDPTPLVDHKAGDSALWMVVERGLKKERNQRWSNMTELGEALALWLYEHGVKEDLSGNSIRAVWLDGVLSGLRADVPESEAPDGQGTTLSSMIRGKVPATGRPLLVSGAGDAVTADGAPWVQRRWRLAAGAAAGLLLIGAVLGLLLRSAPEASAGDVKVTPVATAPPPVKLKPKAVDEPATTAAATPEGRALPRARQVATADARAAPAQEDARLRPSTASTRRPRTAPRKVKAIRDFGF
jgi:serine/threonine-protein kinase